MEGTEDARGADLALVLKPVEGAMAGRRQGSPTCFAVQIHIVYFYFK